jgi:[ribosomal protein S5]-alanine N-acetyltransferase
VRFKPGWPATLREAGLFSEPVVLRPNRVADARAWREIRVRDAPWLRPWETTDPGSSAHYPASVKSYLGLLAATRREAWRGRALPWAVAFGGTFVGQVSIGKITWGSERTGYLGAWIDSRFARHGIMTIAVAMAVDHCFHEVGLHRIVAGIRPENTPSRRGVEKLGFRCEGHWVRQAYVDGEWRDHLCYALTAEEVPDGLLPRCRGEIMASRSGAGNLPPDRPAAGRWAAVTAGGAVASAGVTADTARRSPWTHV